MDVYTFVRNGKLLYTVSHAEARQRIETARVKGFLSGAAATLAFIGWIFDSLINF